MGERGDTIGVRANQKDHTGNLASEGSFFIKGYDNGNRLSKNNHASTADQRGNLHQRGRTFRSLEGGPPDAYRKGDDRT